MIDLNAFKLNVFKILAQVTAKQMIEEPTNSSWRDLPDEPRPLPDGCSGRGRVHSALP
ncbi:hypothetical protein [Streptomyces virginiae]